MIFVGIDPGLKGAIAFISPDDAPIDGLVADTPTAEVKSGKKTKTVYLPSTMSNVLRQLVGKTAIVTLENVHAMPKQGVSSMFSMGRGVGLWEGIIAALHLPLDYVTPQKWQKEMLGSKRGKDASRVRAQELFPHLADQLERKGDDGRADALLIAEWRHRQSPSYESS